MCEHSKDNFISYASFLPLCVIRVRCKSFFLFIYYSTCKLVNFEAVHILRFLRNRWNMSKNSSERRKFEIIPGNPKISHLLTVSLSPPPPFPSLGNFICSYIFMPSLLLHLEWSYHFFSVDTGGLVFKMFSNFIICPTNIPSFYFQTVNLPCTRIQFVPLVWTVLSDELVFSWDVSFTPMGKVLLWLAYSHYLVLGYNIT